MCKQANFKAAYKSSIELNGTLVEGAFTIEILTIEF